MEEHARRYTKNQDNITPKHISNNSSPWEVLDYSRSDILQTFMKRVWLLKMGLRVCPHKVLFVLPDVSSRKIIQK